MLGLEPGGWRGQVWSPQPGPAVAADCLLWESVSSSVKWATVRTTGDDVCKVFIREQEQPFRTLKHCFPASQDPFFTEVSLQISKGTCCGSLTVHSRAWLPRWPGMAQPHEMHEEDGA